MRRGSGVSHRRTSLNNEKEKFADQETKFSARASRRLSKRELVLEENLTTANQLNHAHAPEVVISFVISSHLIPTVECWRVGAKRGFVANQGAQPTKRETEVSGTIYLNKFGAVLTRIVNDDE